MFSFSPRVNNKYVNRYDSITLSDLVTLTKSGYYQKMYLNISANQIKFRSAPTDSAKDAIKVISPYIMPAGIFKTKTDNDILTCSCVAFGDADNVQVKDYNYVKQVLTNNPYVIFVKESISGNGFHFLFRYQQTAQDITGKKQEYKNAIATMYDVLRPEIADKAKLDVKVNNIGRAMILSYDPDCYFQNDKKFLKPLATAIVVNDKVLEDVYSPDNFIIDDLLKQSNDTQEIFDNCVELLKSNGIEWCNGNRNNFLTRIVALLRPYHIPAEEVTSLVLNHIAGKYTSRYYPEYIRKTLHTLVNDINYTPAEFKSSPTANDCVYYNKYVSEKIGEIAEFINKSGKFLIVTAQTGAGKTTMITELFRDKKVDIIMPTTSLVHQQTNLTRKTGSGFLTKEEIYAQYFCTTWASIGKLEERAANILIIDEGHAMVCDDWKYENIKAIQKRFDSYEKVIFLTGTPEPLLGLKLPILQCIPINNQQKQYSIITTPNTDSELFLFRVREERNAQMVYYKNDKNELDAIYDILSKEGYKVAYISSDRKGEEEYQKIINEQMLTECQVLLTTCLIQAGVNILNADSDIEIYFGKGCHVIDIIQFSARFRNLLPKVFLITSGNLNRTLDLQWLSAERMNQLKNDCAFLNLAEKQMAKRSTDELNYQYRLRETEQRYKGIFKKADGWYLDKFYLESQYFSDLIHNCNTNMYYLQRILSASGWKCISIERILATDDEQLRNSRKNASDRKQKESIGFVSSLFNMPTESLFNFAGKNEMERELISRFRKLSGHDKPFNHEDIISKSKYQAKLIQFAVLENENIVKSNKIQSNENVKVYTENQYYLNLKRKLKDGHYTGSELRAILRECKFADKNIKNVIGIVWKIEDAGVKKVNGKTERIYRLVEPVTDSTSTIGLNEVEWLFPKCQTN